MWDLVLSVKKTTENGRTWLQTRIRGVTGQVAQHGRKVRCLVKHWIKSKYNLVFQHTLVLLPDGQWWLQRHRFALELLLNDLARRPNISAKNHMIDTGGVWERSLSLFAGRSKCRCTQMICMLCSDRPSLREKRSWGMSAKRYIDL